MIFARFADKNRALCYNIFKQACSSIKPTQFQSEQIRADEARSVRRQEWWPTLSARREEILI